MSDLEPPSYGTNAARLRGKRNQQAIAEAGGWEKQSFVSQLEKLRGGQVPSPATIRRHAKALGVEPWQLLEGVQTEIDQLRNRRDLLRHGDRVESPDGEKLAEVRRSQVGTESATSGVEHPSRKAPDVDARLREEVAELRAALDVVAQAIIATGAAEAPKAHKVAPRKPRHRRGARKRA